MTASSGWMPGPMTTWVNPLHFQNCLARVRALPRRGKGRIGA